MTSALQMMREADRLRKLALATQLRTLVLRHELAGAQRVPHRCPDCTTAFAARVPIGGGVTLEVAIHDDTCPNNPDKETR